EPRLEKGAFVLRGRAVWTRSPEGPFVNDRKEWGNNLEIMIVERELRYRPREYLLIRDNVTSPKPSSYATRLHFDRRLELSPDGRGFISRVDDRVELLDECAVTVHRGEMNPVRGWQTVGYLKVEPATTLEAISPGQNRTFTWLISFDGHSPRAVSAAPNSLAASL